MGNVSEGAARREFLLPAAAVRGGGKPRVAAMVTTYLERT